MNPTTNTVQHISDCFIKPQHMPEEANHPYYLAPWDLAMLSVYYIQKGLLFPKPSPVEDFNIIDFLDKLKRSLALTLVHFFPLAGRLATSKSEDPPSYVVNVDCKNSPGARFIHASVDMSISDVLSPTYVPLVVQSFFDHHRALNHDGHFMSLLTIQVTDLTDGVFIGCSMNHTLGDGSSYWQFLNSFSEIFLSQGKDIDIKISRPPIMKRWFPDGCGPIINFPFTHHDQFIAHFEPPLIKERMFHFSSESIARLKAKANTEHNTNKISSFQSLSAFMWRCITRSRHLPHDQVTSCRMACNNRSRMYPPLSDNYFGNCIHALGASTTAGELVEHNLGWAAWKLHQAVVNHNDKVIREFVESWLKSPYTYKMKAFDPYSVMMGSSPRFNKYGSEFGLGKALALRSGYSHKFSGKVSCYPGREGGGSVDLEVCLPPDVMTALESDREFMEIVSFCP